MKIYHHTIIWSIFRNENVNYRCKWIDQMSYCHRSSSLQVEQKFRKYANQHPNTFHLSEICEYGESRRKGSNSKAIDDDYMTVVMVVAAMMWLCMHVFFPSSSSGYVSIGFNYFNKHRYYVLLHTTELTMWKLNIVRSIDINSETQYNALSCVRTCVCVCVYKVQGERV